MAPEQPVRILVVDDKADKAKSLAALLSELGEIETAHSGKEALRKLLTQSFAVILLDVNMPGMDGFETAELIRQRDICARTPIIFVTSFYDAETHRTRAYKLGAVDYILAPVIPEVLKAKVSVFVDLYRKTEEVRLHAEERVQLMEEQVARVAAEAARAAAEDSERRAALLAEASRVLNSSGLKCEEHLGAIAQLVVKSASDACMIAVLQSGRLHCSAWAHSDVCKPRSVEQSMTTSALERNGAFRRVLQRCQPEIQHKNAAMPQEHAEWIEATGAHSAMLTPIRARNQAIGVVWFGSCHETRAFGTRDLALAEDLSGRIGVAIDNSRLYNEAQMANRMKDEFLAIVSHELRTPLTPILGWTRMMLKGSLEPEKFPQGLQIIERNVVAQMKLIDDLLDVSRITTGKLRLNLQNVDLLAIVQNSIESVRPAADAKQLKVVSKLDSASRMVSADAERLQQVLWNLLSNAVKFTPHDGEISVSLHYEGENAVLKVADSGVGISSEFLPFVFERFRQADSSSTRSFGGLGLGLAIVRHLVELHGGSVRAESAGEGRGSIFTVQLPSNLSLNGSAPEKKAEPTFGESLTGLRILLVEDDPDTRELLVSILNHHGATAVHQAGTAPEALERLDGAAVDLVISDIGLPGLNGYALIKKIRSRDCASANVPAIALTAYAREEDQASAFEAGFQLHMPKPIDPECLLASITTLMKERGATGAVRTASAKRPA